jgi:hypothetical protein
VGTWSDIEEEEEHDSKVKKEDLDSEISYGWTEEDLKDWEGTEPLPSSTYTGSGAPTPPASPTSFNDFDESFDESFDEPLEHALSSARRSSPSDGEEHNVTEPPFLTAQWETENFPTANYNNEPNYREWDVATMGCYSAQQWIKWTMDRPID